jgi:hypothetical protein
MIVPPLEGVFEALNLPPDPGAQAILWPNRPIGDAIPPKEKRRAFTNVRTFDILETPFSGCRKCGICKKNGESAERLPSGPNGPARVLADRGGIRE